MRDFGMWAAVPLGRPPYALSPAGLSRPRSCLFRRPRGRYSAPTDEFRMVVPGILCWCWASHKLAI